MLNPLQERLLEMLRWLTNYLHQNKLRYYIIGGTMLGAVRHHGFIPWDDDVDIGMPRNDYNRLIELLKKPTEHYVVEASDSQNKDYIYGFAKFYDTDTSMTELARKNIMRGVYIDIFPLDGIGNTWEESLENYKKIDRVHMLLSMCTCAYRKERIWWKNAAVFIGRLIPVNPRKLSRKFDLLCAEHNYDEYLYVGNLFSTYRSRDIMSKDIFGVPTLYDFEGLKVYGPEKYDEYLKKIYGDWRKLPPEDKRHSAHDFIDIDLNRSYL